MPDIDIRHTHSLGRQACRAATDAVARELSAQFGLRDLAWNGDTLHFTGPGIEGRLAVHDDDVHVQLRLAPLLGLMRPAIEAGVRRHLYERLG